MNEKKINSNYKISIIDIIIYYFALTAPLSTTFMDVYNLIIISSLMLIALFLILGNKQIITISKPIKIFIFSYFMFNLIGLSSLILSIKNITSQDYLLTVISRISTISISVLIIVTIAIWMNYQSRKKIFLFLKMCFLSTLIFSALGLYQLIAFKFNLPFIDTRSSVYGASYEIQQNIGFRLTSITREPNFYSPILIESILLSIIFLRKFLLAFFVSFIIFLIYKTHSTGAYLHLLLIAITLMFFIKTKKILIAPIIIFSVFILIYNTIALDQYFLDKLATEIRGDSARSNTYIIILNEFINSNFLHLLFGYGMNTLQLFNELTQKNYNINFSVSNNFYLDILWDSGLLGINIFMCGMAILFSIFKKAANLNRIGFIGFILFINILITSLYRSEYTTMHFIWIFSITFICHRLAIIDKENKICS